MPPARNPGPRPSGLYVSLLQRLKPRGKPGKPGHPSVQGNSPSLSICRGRDRKPALVAFSPTNHDPRPERATGVLPPASLQRT